MSNRVCVIGGMGFIGTRLSHRLKADICDPKDGTDIRNGIVGDYDTIVFLAADLGQGREAYSYNLELFSALVKDIVIRDSHPHLIYTSSAAVYGDHQVRVDELSATIPATLYGRVKLIGEYIIQDCFKDYTILRLSNVVGNGGGHGVCDIFQNGGHIIYGNGEQVRDYIHVDSVVDAIVNVLKKPKKHSGKVYNISSGIGRTVNEVFEYYVGEKPKYEPARDFDIEYSVLDNSAAKQAGLL